MSEQEQPRRQTRCLEEGQLMAWHDGALLQSEANEVTAHLGTCARCAALERAFLNDRRQVFALLSSIDPGPSVTPQPVSALAHFRERLAVRSSENPLHSRLHPADEAHYPGRSMLPPPAAEQDDLLPIALPATPPRRPWTWFQTLVAALVIALLLGTVLLLVRPWLPSTGQHLIPTPHPTPAGLKSASALATCLFSTDTRLCTMIDSIGAPMMLRTQAGGLEMTMWITPGPYFLGEMLVADLSLTNLSQSTYLLQGIPSNGNVENVVACHPPFAVQITGGGGPIDAALGKALISLANCWNGPGSEGTVQVQPGQTITFHQVLALTTSGHVTLTARGTFQKAVLGQNGVEVVNASGPLDGHWPALHVSVASQVPPTRAISLQRQGFRVHVVAPTALDNQLLYWPTTSCGHAGGGSSYASWIALPSEIITPDCNAPVTVTPELLNSWLFVVGAPGYAFALEKYPS